MKVPLALLLFTANALVEIHRWEFADCYVPDGLDADAVAPALIVEEGLAETHGKLLPAFSKRLP